jgi:hypothetical protein
VHIKETGMEENSSDGLSFRIAFTLLFFLGGKMIAESWKILNGRIKNPA